MKILIDPMLVLLAKEISTAEKAELLMCILEYPNRDCDLGLWKYVKQQIDADMEKYREKCKRMAENGRRRWESKSYPINSKSEVIVSSSGKENEIKNNCNESVSSNAAAFVDNSVDKYLISNTFSFEWLGKQKPRFTNYLMCYQPAVIERAERTLKEKCAGQRLTIGTIARWIQKESEFFNQNNGGGNEFR
jgi:hypothetical protein